MTSRFRYLALILSLCLLTAASSGAPQEAPWPRHTIDATSRGADGVRLADANADGLMDIATGWEEGGVIRVYLNPGPENVGETWPAVTAGQVASPEDAVLVDLDHDGAIDVVSACEGDTRSLWVHWAPRDPARYLDAGAWRTEPIPASQGAAKWMFSLPFDCDGRHGIDIIAGAKGQDAQLGWFESPQDPRGLAAWKWRPIRPLGWLMSLISHDLDKDGDPDIIFSDRKGPARGVHWLENTPNTPPQQWPIHTLGATDHEVMFLTVADLDQDQVDDILATTLDNGLILLQRTPSDSQAWEGSTIPLPPGAGTGKGIAIGDIDLDGRPDIAFSCEHAQAKHGVMYCTPPSPWTAHPVSGPTGTKYDLVQLIDLDHDTDLDILTCEEHENLGVFWYENPTRSPNKPR